MKENSRSETTDAIRKISNAAANLTLYSASHSQVKTQSAMALHHFRKAFGEVSGDISLVLIDQELFFENRPLERSMSVAKFCKSMQIYGFSHLTISRDINEEDVSVLVNLVARNGMPVPYGRNELGNLSFGRVQLADGDAFSSFDICNAYEELTDEQKESLSDSFDSISSGKSFDMKGVVGLVSGFINAFRKEANPLFALAPLRLMDEYTFTHSVDVCILNIAQGMSLGIEGQQLHDIGISGMLHDVGKMQVDYAVLNKGGALTEEEWAEMRRHPMIGAEYLLSQPGIPRMAVIASYEHHMKYDLSGYPAPPKGWKLSLCSQMTMISDCFDALRTRRVYKEAMDFEECAGKLLELAGKSLNPALTVNFVKLLRSMGEGNIEPQSA